MKNKVLLLTVILLLILSLTGYYIYNIWATQIDVDKIYEGIKIDGLDVGNMSKNEALDYIKKEKIEEESSSIRLFTDETEYNMDLSEIDYTYDYEAAINEAYRQGKSGNFVNRYKKINELEKTGLNIELPYNYSEEKLKAVAEKVGNNVSREEKNAQFIFNGGNFIIEPEEKGVKVDKEELALRLEKSVIEKHDELEIPIQIIEAKYKVEDYQRINGVIGQYTTRYPNSSQGRKQNIKISSQAINGIILNPGETMSYNSLTGPRSRSNGYVEAPIILNNDYIPGVGGGVCQTSTTLYNALVQADISIVERYNHTIPPPYVSKGTDAVVTDGPLDLKFKNDFDFPVYIASYADNVQQTISIYGDTNVKNYSVRLEPEIIETIPAKTENIMDPNLPLGQKILDKAGRNGYRVRTYKTKIQNGSVIDRVLMSEDYYDSANFVYRIGQGPAAKVETPQASEQIVP